MSLTFPTRGELFRKAVLLARAYTDGLTWFGVNSVIGAVLQVSAFMGEIGSQLAAATQRRSSLLAAEGEDLDNLLAESGTERRAGTRAQVLVVLRPFRASVTDITIGGGTGTNDLIEVDDSSGLDVGMSIRIRSEDAAITEAKTIVAITVGTGPSGNDEIEVTALAGTYPHASTDVAILARVTIPAGSTFATSSGVSLSTLEEVTTGDANPALDGMSTAVSLADVAIAEADEVGTAGNIAPYDITDLATPITGLLEAFNPVAAQGGTDEESDAQARVRAIGQPAAANLDTEAWLYALARAGDEDVLRVRVLQAEAINEINVGVLTRSGGALGSTAKTALAEYLADRSRAALDISIDDITLTEVSIVATVSLSRGATLREVWIAVCSAVADYLDYETWEWGTDVDAGTLYDVVRAVTGVESIDPDAFTPGADVTVGADSLPVLVNVQLVDAATGDTVSADLSAVY